MQQKWYELGSYLNEKCQKCGQKILFMYQYDAHCCILCNEWLDSVCDDPNCSFCSQRPQTPYEAYYKIEIPFDRKSWRQEKYGHKTNGTKRHKKKKELLTDILEKRLILL